MIQPFTAAVWEGDSNTNGFGVNESEAFRTLVYADSLFAEHSPAGAHNIATDGATIDIIDDRYMAQVYPLRPSALGSAATVLFLLVGSNNNNDPAAQVAAKIAAYVERAQGHGFTVVLMTVPPRYAEGNRRELNRLILQMRPDCLVDLAGRLGFSFLDTAVFSDQLHLTALGHHLAYRAIISSLLSNEGTAYQFSIDGSNATLSGLNVKPPGNEAAIASVGGGR